MAVAEGGQDVAELRRELERERHELAAAIGDLEEAVSIGRRLRARPWLVRGGALVLGLATVLVLVVRPIRRRRRRERVIATFDRFALVRRRP